MNEQERFELRRLEVRQESLAAELELLRKEIERFKKRTEGAATQPIAAPAQASQEPLAPTAPTEPWIPPPPPPSTDSADVPVAQPQPVFQYVEEPTVDTGLPPVLEAPPVIEAVPTRGVEERLGTVWLVRLGVLFLLAGLVFLAAYSYHAFLMDAGPIVHMAMLYAMAGAVLAGGIALEKFKPKYLPFARVITAGGLAAVYVVTFAGWAIEPLRVFPHPFFASLLLVLWSCFMVWLADRKCSSTIAGIAFPLAFFGAAVSTGSIFALGSGLALAAGAVVVLYRNRWPLVSLASLFSGYFGYIFWKIFRLDEGVVSGTPDPWLTTAYLAIYWLVFAVASFLLRRVQYHPALRGTLATFNNILFFLIGVATVDWGMESMVWKIGLGFGAVLLLLSAMAGRWGETCHTLARNYLANALIVLVMAGAAWFSQELFAIYLGGIVLACLVAARNVKGAVILITAAYLLSLLGAIVAVPPRMAAEEGIYYTGYAFMFLMLLSTVWATLLFPKKPGAVVSWPACWFALLAVLVLLTTVYRHPEPIDGPMILSLIGFAFVLLTPLHRSFEIAFAGVLVLLAGALSSLTHDAGPGYHWALAWAQPTGLMGAAIMLGYWYGHKPSLSDHCQSVLRAVGIGCMAISILLYSRQIQAHLQGPMPMIVMCFLSLVWVLAGKKISSAAVFTGFFLWLGSAFFSYWGLSWQDNTYGVLLGILFAAAAQQLAAQRHTEVHGFWKGTLAVLCAMMFWGFLTARYNHWGGLPPMPVRWAFTSFVLMAWGIVGKQKVYRWCALFILLCTIGKLIVVDVWELGLLARALAFLALAVVLILLGFLYNKYQERIRTWL